MLKWVLAIHLIFVISWMAALFYLPRLFVYHCETMDTHSDQRFKTMEKKLFYIIATPAAILTISTGLWLAMSATWQTYHTDWWFDIKLIFVALLIGFHGLCWKYMQDFKSNRNPHSGKFYRFFNEIPTLLMIAIVILVVVKPF